MLRAKRIQGELAVVQVRVMEDRCSFVLQFDYARKHAVLSVRWSTNWKSFIHRRSSYKVIRRKNYFAVPDSNCKQLSR